MFFSRSSGSPGSSPGDQAAGIGSNITVELSGGTARTLSSCTIESPPQSSQGPSVAQRAVRAGAGYDLRGLEHKTLVHIDQRGETVYMDLMGPFKPDLSNTVYELTVVEGKHGWIEVTGLKDKSAPVAAEGLSRVVTDVMNNSNQNPRDIGRFHSDQGREFVMAVQYSISKILGRHQNVEYFLILQKLLQKYSKNTSEVLSGN